jgi:hypothetical protein
MSWQDYQLTPNVGPPIDVLPGYMDSLRVLALTDNVAISVGGFRVWDVGFLFTLSVRLSPKGMPNLHRVTLDLFGHGKPSVLLEMRWPDGKRVSNAKPQRRDARHTFHIRSGGGSGPQYDVNWWVSPLPGPPGITLACTWTAASISEATVEVSTQELRKAASRQIPLWT